MQCMIPTAYIISTLTIPAFGRIGPCLVLILTLLVGGGGNAGSSILGREGAARWGGPLAMAARNVAFLEPNKRAAAEFAKPAPLDMEEEEDVDGVVDDVAVAVGA